jgi:membrane protease YdiL (CAAX protease family)
MHRLASSPSPAERLAAERTTSRVISARRVRALTRKLDAEGGAGQGAWVAFAYCALGATGAILAAALGYDPWACASWLGTSGWAAVLVSLGLGLAVALVTIGVTRAVVPRAIWARALHADLRPVVHGQGDGALVLMAIASGVGEELLFRGLLTPLVGVVLSSLAFGLMHQVRGTARWAWALWATLMGLVFASLFRLTGSLAGPIAAHVIVNAVNLRYLRDEDPAPRAKALGGLLVQK